MGRRAHEHRVAVRRHLQLKSVPMVPLAPVRFSTTTWPPHDSVIFCATIRAVRSTGPPAVNGAMMRIGLAGYGWADNGTGNDDGGGARARFGISFEPPLAAV